MPSAPSRRSPATTASSGPRPWPRSPARLSGCCATSTSRPSTGCICGQRMKVARAAWHCRHVVSRLGSVLGVVDPGAKSRAVGLGVLPRSLVPSWAGTSRPSGGGHALACRFAWWRLGLEADDELAVGDLGLLGQGTFAPADLLQ